MTVPSITVRQWGVVPIATPMGSLFNDLATGTAEGKYPSGYFREGNTPWHSPGWMSRPYGNSHSC